MMFCRWIVRLALLPLLLGVAGQCYAEFVEGNILQTRLRRLYFDVGRESRIFPGNRFILFHKLQQICSGVIEESHLAVSFSQPLTAAIDTSILPELLVLIQAADFDTATSIALGTMGLSDAEARLLWDRPPCNTPATEPCGTRSAMGNEIHFYGDVTAWKLRQHDIDGFFSITRRWSAEADYPVEVRKAPYIAIMLPNLARSANEGGFLTTALYYYYDDRRVSLHFSGDSALAVNGLVMSDAPRSYPFHRDLGRRSLERVAQSTRRITIAAANADLEKSALYFADVMSQVRIRPTLTGNLPDSADIILTMIPYSDSDPSVCIREIVARLSVAPVSSVSQREKIEMVRMYLESAERDSTEAGRTRRYHEAGQLLTNDLGVFPLFRPILFFHRRERLAGIEYDGHGRLTTSRLTRLSLPAANPGDSL
jgi:hypothetical protein